MTALKNVLQKAAREDELAFLTDAALCRALRRLGLPLRDGQAWLYER